MIKLLVCLFINIVDSSKPKPIYENKLWSLITKLKKHTVIRNLLSWIVFLMVPFILFYSILWIVSGLER